MHGAVGLVAADKCRRARAADVYAATRHPRVVGASESEARRDERLGASWHHLHSTELDIRLADESLQRLLAHRVARPWIRHAGLLRL